MRVAAKPPPKIKLMIKSGKVKAIIAMSVFSTVRGKERVRVPSSPNERHAKFPSVDR